MVQVPKQEMTTSYQELIDKVCQQGKRTIYLQEIAMAILIGSCEENCNQNFDRARKVFSHAIKLPTQNHVLALETETDYFSMESCKPTQCPYFIPDTLEAPQFPNPSVGKDQLVANETEKKSFEEKIERTSLKRIAESESGSTPKKTKLSTNNMPR